MSSSKPKLGLRVIAQFTDGMWYTGSIHKLEGAMMTVEWDEGGRYVLDDYYKRVFPINTDDWDYSSEGYEWNEVKDYILKGKFLDVDRTLVDTALKSALTKLAKGLKSPLKELPSVRLNCQVWSEQNGVAEVYMTVEGGALGKSKFNLSRGTNALFVFYEREVEPKIRKELTKFGFDHKVRVGNAITRSDNATSIDQIMITKRYVVGAPRTKTIHTEKL